MKMPRNNKELKPESKEDVIRLRVSQETKEEFNKIMESKGTTASDYLRQYIIETINRYNLTQEIKPAETVLNDIHIPNVFDLDQRVDKIESEIDELKSLVKIIIKTYDLISK